MTGRSQAVTWMAGLLVAAPMIGLFFLARATTGWIAVAAWIGLFALFVAVLVVGFRDQTTPLDSDGDGDGSG